MGGVTRRLASTVVTLLSVSHTSFPFSSALNASQRTFAASSSSGLRSIAPTDLFSSWATQDGRVERMAQGHTPAVNEMLSALSEHLDSLNNDRNCFDKFTFLDIGCGSGWVCRKVLYEYGDKFDRAIGVDGASEMISKAIRESTGHPSCSFYHVDLNHWNFEETVDVGFSMEALYYLKPEEIHVFLSMLSQKTIKKGGYLLLGVDHYLENKDCHGWSELNNCHMTLWSERQWTDAVGGAGFEIIKQFRAAKRDDMLEGTMVIFAKNVEVDS